MQIVRRFLSQGSRLKNCFLVVAKHLQPACNVIRVVSPRFERKAKVRTEKSGSEFGDKFFPRVVRCPETARLELARNAYRMSCRMHCLMCKRRKIRFLLFEKFKRRHLHVIFKDAVEGSASAVPNRD